MGILIDKHDYSLMLSYYYYDMQDTIVYRNSTHLNLPSSVNQGIECNGALEYQSHHLKAMYLYSDASDYLGDPLDFSPKHRAKIEDRYEFNTNVDFFASLSYTDTSYNFYADERYKLDSYTLMDIQLSYQPSSSLDMRIGIKNLSDTSYEWRYGFPAEGRSFYASLDWSL